MMLYRSDRELIDGDYFLFALQFKQIQMRLDVISGGSTVGHVKVGDIRSLLMFRPNSQSEQELVSASLNQATNRVTTEIQLREKLKK